MSNKAEKIADLIVLIEQLQLDKIAFITQQLGLDEVKLLNSEVVSKINNYERRGELRILLTKRVRDLNQQKKQDTNELDTLLPNVRVSDQLNTLYEKYTQTIVDELFDTQLNPIFLMKAKYDELFIILNLLEKKNQNEYEKLSIAIRDELDRKAVQDGLYDWKKNYKTLSKACLVEAGLESQIWSKVINRINSAKSDLQKKSTVVAGDTPPVVLSFLGRLFVRLVNWFIRAWSNFIGLFTSPDVPKAPDGPPENVYQAELSEEEHQLFDEMRMDGAEYARELAGKSGIGDVQSRSMDVRECSIRGRYGIVLASQVVAGTRGKNHGDLSTVVESLSESSDDSATVDALCNTITQSISDEDEANPLKQEHVFSLAGNDALVTALEAQDLRNIIASDGKYSEYGLSFTLDEMAQIEQYKTNVDRSRALNNAIASISFSWGGYESDKNGGYKKKDKDFDSEQKKLETRLAALSKSVLNACSALKDGEALYLDTGLEGHAMKLAIKRIGEEFVLTCYDSSGALENSTLSESLIGLLQLNMMAYEAKRSNALSFTIPAARLLSPNGVTYFHNLIRQHTYAGWAETNITENLSHSTREERRLMGPLGRIMALWDQSKVYLAYINKFTAIADPNSPPQFDPLLQLPQNTSNCFAKRLQSCQLYELGKPTYKKLRMAILIEQKNGLIADACGRETEIKGEEEPPIVDNEYIYMLKNIPLEFLSPDELHETSVILSEIADVPTKEYYVRFFNSLIQAKDALVLEGNSTNQVAIEHINKKIGSHIQAYYLYLKKGNRLQEIKQIFSPEVYRSDNTFDWNTGTLALKNVNGTVDPAALAKLSDFAAAQAWKASIRLINHQIKKLTINERYIHSANERLKHAGFSDAFSTVTTEDLENANIVNYTTGFSRSETTKIEINIAGERREIDKQTFFRLVVANKKAMTIPSVINLLEYLRNVSPQIEKRFVNLVYPEQHKAFEDRLASIIENTSNFIQQGIVQLVQYEEALDRIISESDIKLKELIDDIQNKKESSGSGVNALKLKNLELRQEQIEKELGYLKALKRSVAAKKIILEESETVRGSAQYKILMASKTLDKIRANEPGMRSVRDVTNAFSKVQTELDTLGSELKGIIKYIKSDDIETKISEKANSFDNYRRQVIHNCLQINPDFRILQELSEGRMGTEKERNQHMYTDSSEDNELASPKKASGYREGSLYAKIQNLNKNLKERTFEILEHKIILGTNNLDDLNSELLKSLVNSENSYNQLEEYSLSISKLPIPQEIKSEWVREMFHIWLEHENKEILYLIGNKDGAELTSAVNRAFQHFIEQKANIKFAALKSSDFPIELTRQQIEEMGWKPISLEEIEHIREQRIHAAMNILKCYKSGLQNKIAQMKNTLPPRERVVSVQLKATDLHAQHDVTIEHKEFTGPKEQFLSQSESGALDSSTLSFLRKNRVPKNKGLSKYECFQYYDSLRSYLNRLKSHNGLENKRERLIEFCIATSSNLFALPYAPPEELIKELSNTLLTDYRDLDGSLVNSFLKLENTERSQLLTALLHLTLAGLQFDEQENAQVTPECFSIIKQWERLILPPDSHLSEKISRLTSGGHHPKDISLLKQVDNAIHASPIGLEGIYEAQKGIQSALTVYGRENGVDSELRKLSDRLMMRNGDALLPKQFIHYYSTPSFLFSSDGINSTQGREFFTRAFLDAYYHASKDEKFELLHFLLELKFNEGNASQLKTPHDVFRAELLIKCATLDAKKLSDEPNSQDVVSPVYDSNPVNVFIDTLTNKASLNAEDRLFGFAKEINLLSMEIENHFLNDSSDEASLDGLYSRLICANLAYHQLLEQASEEVKSNLGDNFEYKREMALVQANLNKLHDRLINFAGNLGKNNRAAVFNSVINAYKDGQKFDGAKLKVVLPSSYDVPGFIALGSNIRLDILHGVIYVGNSKHSVMPSFISSHNSVQELGLDNHPFKPDGNSYLYVEGNEIKASITQLVDGTLVIQRELQTLDGQTKLLQYLPPEHLDTLPLAVKNRINAEHFFLDSSGAVHAFTADFAPLLKLSEQSNGWIGELVDHRGNRISIQLDNIHEGTSPACRLIKIFPFEEMLSVDQVTVYIPSIQKYVVHDSESNHYYITDSLAESTPKRLLILTEQGAGYTEKVLTPLESEEVNLLNVKIVALKDKLSSIKKGALISIKDKKDIASKIHEHEMTIKKIKSPEYFVFVPDSPLIKNLEQQCQKLRQEMHHAYLGLMNKKADSIAHYEEAKNAYFSIVEQLKKNNAEAGYLFTYDISLDGSLLAKDFQSTLHIGTLPGKTPVWIEQLGKSIPKVSLKSGELENLRAIRKEYEQKEPLTKDDRIAIAMMLGIELQNHLLQREESLRGKRVGWDRAGYEQLLIAFSKEIKSINEEYSSLPEHLFSGLWREIESEFGDDEALQLILGPKAMVLPLVPKKPINLNTKTTYMPIESIGARTLIQFTPHDDIYSLIDREQMQLEARLTRGLGELSESIQTQEDGYYYENYGLITSDTITQLFNVSPDKKGAGGLSKVNVAALFDWLHQQRWIKPVPGMDKFQLIAHPSEFFSSPKVAAYFNEMGFQSKDIKMINERLEVFLYEMAVNGGRYSIKPEILPELIEKISSDRERCTDEVLLAQSKIESLLGRSSKELSMAELNAAYLLNDFSKVLSYFPEEERRQTQIALNYGLTRLMFYKTEADHLNDVLNTFNRGNVEKAISMLHVKRNYQLGNLLDSEIAPEDLKSEEGALKVEQDRKMQRAFLLFETEFGHRCTMGQVNVFRGLLLDDETDPDKIDSAQARMGFGKTSLLPLVALYKTGDKLVRFIVPKSALETNTADMSSTLSNIIKSRAVKDDFQRYSIVADPEAKMDEDSPRLKSLKDAKDDLRKRLTLYKRVRDSREVLVQAPSVRNALECQEEIFLDLLLKIRDEPKQEKELMQCISLINEIRSLTTISIFDELDSTQDPHTTDVNYTSGEKIAINAKEIYPLELIAQVICTTEDRSIEGLASLLLSKLGIVDEDRSLFDYVTSLQTKQPSSVTSENSTDIYLIRAILTDPSLLSLFTEKEPGTDFGVWFENSSDGSRRYDLSPSSANKREPGNPLLIAVPYSAAQTPKPQGSRFDNPEVTAITTLLYYLDPRTVIEDVPHLEFLINSFRNGVGEAPFLNTKGNTSPEFISLFNDIKELAEIEDPVIRNSARENYFNSRFGAQTKGSSISLTAFRKVLARTIIQEQIKFDEGKANSNRYEQGTVNDVVLGFSGTAGDTSPYFNKNRLDPAADGNMTLGIMGRKNCQQVISLDTAAFIKSETDYTTALLEQLSNSFSINTRTLIDVGGLCKASNRAVAKAIALQLKRIDSPVKDNGVIYYDDVTNTKKLLVLNSNNNETVLDLTQDMVDESDINGSYFTYYDQAHARGADIKQMDGANAVITLNFSVTNNEYKQAIMRMRKIIDKMSGQSFTPAVPDIVREKIISDLKLKPEHELTGNDIAYWLRQKELLDNSNTVSLLIKELDSIIKNSILQEQAALTRLMSEQGHEMNAEQIALFRSCIEDLNKISPFITRNVGDLQAKYGRIVGHVQKNAFLEELVYSFESRLTTVFDSVGRARANLNLPSLTAADKQPYYKMKESILQKRKLNLSDEFTVPVTSNSLAEVHSESESQSESQSQSQSQTQTHSFSQVMNEDVVVEAQLHKQDIPYKPVSIDYLASDETLISLPLAYRIAHMNNLFNKQDLIRCSPAYMDDKQLTLAEKPLPPVRYLLAREKGDPQIILINQDEADLFKKSGGTRWSLYDLSVKKSGVLVPIVGKPIEALKEPLLKKLNFSSYHYEIKGSSLESLASSLVGICTAEQLSPSLTLHSQNEEGAREEITPVFDLPKWGFYGQKAQEIPLYVQQTHKVFNDKWEKNGVTISVGKGEANAEVFISSTLNTRILALSEKMTNSDNPSIIRTTVSDVSSEYNAARDQRNSTKDELKKSRELKKQVISDLDEKIRHLTARKEEALQRAKTKINSLFTEDIKQYLDVRNPNRGFMRSNLVHFCKAKDFGHSITAYNKSFPSLGDALQSSIESFILKPFLGKKDYTPQQLTFELNVMALNIAKEAHKVYKNVSFYEEKKGTFIDEMVSVLKRMQGPGKNKKKLLIDLSQVKLWGDTFEHVLEEHFNNFYTTKEEWGALKACFENALFDFCLGKDFEQCLIANIEAFGNKIDPSGGATFELLTLLSYTLNTGDKDKYTEAVQDDIKQIVRTLLLERFSEPRPEEESLFLEASSILKEGIKSFNYNLPLQLTAYQNAPVTIQEMTQYVKQALLNQNVKASAEQINALSKYCVDNVLGFNAIDNLLARYTPIENRGTVFTGADGKEYTLSSDSHDALAFLDKEILSLDEQIKDIEAQKKSQLISFDEKQKVLIDTLKLSNEQVKVLKTEKSACNKLLSGLKNLLSVFSEQQVLIEERDPASFIDKHFNLREIIRDKHTLSVNLSFNPPEFYTVCDDMEMQLKHMNGLNLDETSSENALHRALSTVANEATTVKVRPHVVAVTMHATEHQGEARQKNETRVSETLTYFGNSKRVHNSNPKDDGGSIDLTESNLSC
ncbi:hypothetical protein [uncultured Legionella sp.]|mgnify:CR=1 FL=1|uniref:hypothetical protein n=1 Tax=uncultured Legionella sp. TaxID=210934 RepID=UPI002608D32A|nr:hypothetical protein [uncultured Legionella sp.]